MLQPLIAYSVLLCAALRVPLRVTSRIALNVALAVALDTAHLLLARTLRQVSDVSAPGLESELPAGRPLTNTANQIDAKRKFISGINVVLELNDTNSPKEC